MLQIREEQINQRWASLPLSLKEAIFSESNTDIVWHIGEECGLDEERIKTLVTITSDIIMGFLSVDDFESELKNNIDNLDPKNIALISKEITEKIFTPILEDLKANYAPPVKEFISHPADHPMPEHLPHEGVFSPLKYQELRAKNGVSKPTHSTGSGREVPEREAMPKEIPSEEAEPENAEPFILHEEGGLSTQSDDNLLNVMPRLDLKGTNYSKNETPKPRPARLEIGAASVRTFANPNTVRLVHYTGFVTNTLVQSGLYRPNVPPPQAPRTFNLPKQNPSAEPPLFIIPKPQIPKIQQVPVKPLTKGERIVPIPIRPASAAKVEGNTIYV